MNIVKCLENEEISNLVTTKASAACKVHVIPMRLLNIKASVPSCRNIFCIEVVRQQVVLMKGTLFLCVCIWFGVYVLGCVSNGLEIDFRTDVDATYKVVSMMLGMPTLDLIAQRLNH